MNPERYQRIQSVLQAALEKEPGQRSVFLNQACAGDESLRRQVESLIVSGEQAESFRESPAAEMASKLITDDHAKQILGQVLGPYKILSPLGAGGMGEVYLAEDTRLKRKVALKMLRSYYTNDGNRLRRFEREASAVSALNHPNILTIYEIGHTDSDHFIATEFIDGETLRKVMTRGPMSLPEVLDIGMQVASALSAAHGSGVVHRDIKPENIMIRRDGFVKVLDFGIAKLSERVEEGKGPDLDAATMVMTNPGSMVGTVSYMSPEQARGQHVEARTDIWSLGVVLYEMVVGKVPFEGATMSHVIVSILDNEPAPLVHHASDLAGEFERIVSKALAKDLDERYQTAKDLYADLKNLTQELEFKRKLERTPQPVFAAGHGSDSTHADALSNCPNNLPVQLTPLIGRKAETLAVKKQLGRPEVRLLTLTGPGGTGKTRLCLEAATELLNDYADGAFFVALAAIGDPSLVVLKIAQTLGVKEAGAGSLLLKLKEFLRDRQMLLVIDNFEQVVAAAPLIVELLNASPRLKVLMTSRAALRITGEHEFAVSPLSVPAQGQALSIEAVAQYPAVQLFLERASAVRPDFELTSENASAIVEICARLDGLPLAIELAAARVKVLPPRGLLSRLESRLKLLSGGARDLPSRQQTMRGAIAWSYDLLNEEEKKLFRRLSVFVGGWELEAADAICRDSGDFEIEVLEGVESLVDKSLLQLREMSATEPRFLMLETITEFGLEQLTASGEDEKSRRYHADFFMKLAERGETELLGAQQELWLDSFEIEHDNLRAALRWAEENQEAEIGLRLVGALWRFWEMRGYLSEGRERLSAVLSLASTPATMKARLKALYAAGVLADAQCDYSSARSLFEEKLALHRKLNDNWGIANSINNLGIMALRDRDYVGARSLYEESLSIWRKLGNQTAIALSLINLGNVADLQGEYDSAHAFYADSLEVFKQLLDKRGVARSLSHMGDVARHRLDYESARGLYDQSLAILIELGDKRGVANILSDIGDMACERSDYDAARPFYEEGMVIFSELGDVKGIARLFEARARMAAARGRLERALRLAAASASLREEFASPLSPDDQIKLDQMLEGIRRQLGVEPSVVAWSEGRSMPTERAIQYALESDTV